MVYLCRIVKHHERSRMLCTKRYIKSLCEEFPELFLDPVRANELIYDMTFDLDKFEKMPLSKFKNDMYELFGDGGIWK